MTNSEQGVLPRLVSLSRGVYEFCARSARRRFAVSFCVIAILHLGFLFLWPDSGKGGAMAAAALPQAIHLVNLELAPEPVLPPSGDLVQDAAEIEPVDSSHHENSLPPASHAEGLSADSGYSESGFLHASEADALPMPLIDIRSIMNYPEQARRMNAQGVVIAELDITHEGRVHDARLVRGAGWGFDEEVMRKIRRVRFRPALKNGKAVAITAQIPIEFILK